MDSTRKIPAKKIFLGILGILALILLLQNTEVVTLRLLFWSISMSGIIFIPLLIIAGFLAGFFFGKRSRKNDLEG